MTGSSNDCHRLNFSNYKWWRSSIQGAIADPFLWSIISGEPYITESSSSLPTDYDHSRALFKLMSFVEADVIKRIPASNSASKLLERIDSFFAARMEADPEIANCELESLSLSTFCSWDAFFEKLSDLFSRMGDELTEAAKIRKALNAMNAPHLEGLKLTIRVTPGMNFDRLQQLLAPIPFPKPTTVHEAHLVEKSSAKRLPRSVCENCGELHWRSDCPIPTQSRCPTCGIGGHTSSNCRFGPRKSNKSSMNLYWRKSMRCPPVNFVVDSGATTTMTSKKELVQDLKPSFGKQVALADGSKTDIVGEGMLVITQSNKQMSVPACVVPDLDRNLLSVKDLTDSGAEVTFKEDKCHVTIGGQEVLRGEQDSNGSGLYIIPSEPSHECHIAVPKEVLQPERVTLMELHRRLAHLSPEHILRLVKHNLISGYIVVDDTITSCPACLASKTTKLKHDTVADRSPEKAGEIISADLMGPMPVQSLHGERFICQIIDHYSSYTSVRCLKDKSAESVLSHVEDFINFIQQQKGLRVRIFRSDGGTEFVNEKLSTLLAKHGIEREITAPYSPSDNGKVERRNRTLSETMRCLLKDQHLSSRLWGEAAKAAAFVLNRTLTSTVPGVTPYEVIFGHPPDMKGIRCFGERCFAYIEKPKSKLEDRAELGILVGYTNSPSIYRVLLKHGNKIIETRNVRFIGEDESFDMEIDQFTNLEESSDDTTLKAPSVPETFSGWSWPSFSLTSSPSSGNSTKAPTEERPHPDLMDFEPTINNGPSKESSELTENPGLDSTILNTDTPPNTHQNEPDSECADPHDEVDTTGLVDSNEDTQINIRPSTEPNDQTSNPSEKEALNEINPIEAPPILPEPTMSPHIEEPPSPDWRSELHDIISEGRKENAQEASQTTLRRSTRSTRFQGSFVDRKPKRKLSIVSNTSREEGVKSPRFDHSALSSIVKPSISQQPLTVSMALKSEDAELWRAAIDKEMTALEANGTWTLEKLPPGRKAVGSRFVLTRKLAAGTHQVQHKARLVAQGFSQVPGIDFFETFAPVTRIETVFVLLVTACHHKYLVHHVDFNSAYLNAPLDEEIYMSQPKGFPLSTDPTMVLKLNKALYGLKQAGRQWYLLLHSTLASIGWIKNMKDPCLFTRSVNGIPEHILVYVDDVLISAPDLTRVDIIKKELARQFSTKDLGPVSYFLGMQIDFDKQTTSYKVNQADLIRGIAEKFNLHQKPKVTTAPISSSMDLSPRIDDDRATELERLRYASLVGSLLYISRCSRPDIAYAVGLCTRFQSNPSPGHINLAERIACYLLHTIDEPLKLSGEGSFDLTAFSDADWAGDKSCYASTTGFIIYLCSSPVFWCSRKQTCISLSTTEAEYIAMSDCSRYLLYLKDLIACMNHDLNVPTLISDSQSALALCKNEYDTKGSKHINVRYHFIRDHLGKGDILVGYTQSAENLADGLTKTLGIPLFSSWKRDMLSLSELGGC